MKKIVLGVIIVICLVIINNLARSIYNLWQKQELVVATEKELKREKQLHEKLKKQAKAVNEPNYIETVARDKLFLAKPQEQVVIVPDVESAKDAISPKARKITTTHNWQLWAKLFSFPVED